MCVCVYVRDEVCVCELRQLTHFAQQLHQALAVVDHKVTLLHGHDTRVRMVVVSTMVMVRVGEDEYGYDSEYESARVMVGEYEGDAERGYEDDSERESGYYTSMIVNVRVSTRVV